MQFLIHKILHFIHWPWYSGTCYSFYEDDILMMSFKCSTCGHLTGIHKVPEYIFIDRIGSRRY